MKIHSILSILALLSGTNSSQVFEAPTYISSADDSQSKVVNVELDLFNGGLTEVSAGSSTRILVVV